MGTRQLCGVFRCFQEATAVFASHSPAGDPLPPLLLCAEHAAQLPPTDHRIQPLEGSTHAVR